MKELWFIVSLFLFYLSFRAVSTTAVSVNWPEPKLSLRKMSSLEQRNSRTAADRLSALRELMASQSTPLDAYIIPTADDHGSEYIADVDALREWISQFTGSAGTAVVTASQALVWTDGRYYTQFDQEVDLALWTLMGTSLAETLPLETWLQTNLQAGAAVGVDPAKYSRRLYTPLQSALAAYNISLIPVRENLVMAARESIGDPAPARPNNGIITQPVQYTGKTSGAKISDLRTQMNAKGAAALVLTALDDIAYALNLRGSDIAFNPVFFAYLLIPSDGNVFLFWSDGNINQQVSSFLASEGTIVETRPYNDFFTYLEQYAATLATSDVAAKRIWLSHDASEAVHIAASGGSSAVVPVSLVSEVSPVTLAKAVKNEVELEGLRQCHIRDGTALIRFHHWLHEQIDSGATITEIEAVDKLLDLRGEEDLFMGNSFTTIAGAGENGAVIHYAPSREGVQRVIGANDVFLLDSGGQYRDGTTDITRVRHMSSNPTAFQKSAFTRVLKGQILMGTALFPKAVKGNVLDSLARKYLWDVGLDYAHGTGHGVGSFLNVHEGPSGISWRAVADDPGLSAGMIFSNEPGFYKVGEFGIRHEDLVEVINVTPASLHPKAETLLGDFDGVGVLGFNYISLAPYQKEFIDISLLTEDEINFLDTYHARVYATIGPILEQRGFDAARAWLEKETRPLLSDVTSAAGMPKLNSLTAAATLVAATAVHMVTAQ